MKRSIKPLAVILIMGGLIWTALTWRISDRIKEDQVSLRPNQSVSAPTSALSLEEEQARQTVVEFLNWYRDHLQEANRISLVNQSQGEPYSVNMKNAEQYLTFLKNSQGLTDAYLDEKRAYFKELQENFRQHPQDEGPPVGFAIDLVTLNQDVDTQLAEIDSLKMSQLSVFEDEVVLRCNMIDDYEFRIVRQDGRWIINRFLNRSRK